MSELTPSEKKKDVKIIDKNIDDEEEAIESYQEAKEELSTKKGKARAAEIQGDEREHKRELEELKAWENSKPVKKSHFEKKRPEELRNQANVPKQSRFRNTLEQKVREAQREWKADKEKKEKDWAAKRDSWESDQKAKWEEDKQRHEEYLADVEKILSDPGEIIEDLEFWIESDKEDIAMTPPGSDLYKHLEESLAEKTKLLEHINGLIAEGKDVSKDGAVIEYAKDRFYDPGEQPEEFIPGENPYEGPYPGVALPKPEMPEGKPLVEVTAADVPKGLPKGRRGTKGARAFFNDEARLDRQFEELGISKEMLGRQRYVLPKRENANSLSEYVNLNDTRQVIYDENGNPTGELKPASSYHNKVADEVSDYGHSSHYRSQRLIPVQVMTDEEGNELLDEDGNPRYEVDFVRYVRVPMQANQSYKVDENGYLVTDENGHLIPEKKELALTGQEKELTRPGVKRRTKDALDPTKTERGNLGGSIGTGIQQRRDKKGYIRTERYTPGKMVTYKYRVKKEIDADHVDMSKFKKTGKMYYRHIIGYDKEGNPVWEPVYNGWTSYRISNFGKDLIAQSMYFPNHNKDVGAILSLMRAHAETHPDSPFREMDWVPMVNAAEEAIAYFEMYGMSPDGTKASPVRIMGIPFVIAEKGKDGKPIMVQRKDGTVTPKFTLVSGGDIEPMYTTVEAERRRQNLIKNAEIYTQLALWSLKENYGLSVENGDVYVTESSKGWENGMPVAPTIIVKSSKIPEGMTMRDVIDEFTQTYYDALAGSVPEGAQAEIDRMRDIQEKASTSRQKTADSMNTIRKLAKIKELAEIAREQDDFWNDLSAKYGITDDMKKNGGVVGPDGKWLEVEIPGKNGEMQKVRLSPSNRRKINLKIQGEVKPRVYSEDHTIANQLVAEKVIDAKARNLYRQKLREKNIEKGQAWSVYAILKDEAYAEAREWWDSQDAEKQDRLIDEAKRLETEKKKQIVRDKGKNLARSTRGIWSEDREKTIAEAEEQAQGLVDESKRYANYASELGMNKGTAKKVFKEFAVNGTPLSEILSDELGEEYANFMADPKIKAKIDKAEPIGFTVKPEFTDAVEYYNNIISDPKNRTKIKPIYEIQESKNRQNAVAIGKKISSDLANFRKEVRSALDDKKASVDGLSNLLKKHSQILDEMDVNGVKYKFMLKSDLKGQDGAMARKVLGSLTGEDLSMLRGEYLKAYKESPSRNLATKIAILDDIVKMYVKEDGTVDPDAFEAIGTKWPVPVVKFTRDGEVVRASGETGDKELAGGKEGKTKMYTPWKKALSFARDIQLMKGGELQNVLGDVRDIDRRIKDIETKKVNVKDTAEAGQGKLSKLTQRYLEGKGYEPISRQEREGLEPRVLSKEGVVDEEDTLLSEPDAPQTENAVEAPPAVTPEASAEEQAPAVEQPAETEQPIAEIPEVEEPIHAVGDEPKTEEPTTESKKAVRSWNGTLIFADHNVINTPFRKMTSKK